jgi:ABC-type uncharacterized transport system permease subunit
MKNYNEKKKSGCICHRCIVLVITAGGVMMLETLLNVQLALLHSEVDQMNLLLQRRKIQLHGAHPALKCS